MRAFCDISLVSQSAFWHTIVLNMSSTLRLNMSLNMSTAHCRIHSLFQHTKLSANATSAHTAMLHVLQGHDCQALLRHAPSDLCLGSEGPSGHCLSTPATWAPSNAFVAKTLRDMSSKAAPLGSRTTPPASRTMMVPAAQSQHLHVQHLMHYVPSRAGLNLLAVYWQLYQAKASCHRLVITSRHTAALSSHTASSRRSHARSCLRPWAEQRIRRAELVHGSHAGPWPGICL